ncbi:unnamed protein product, partial [Ectocarpus sp. 8 AP-2014]
SGVGLGVSNTQHNGLRVWPDRRRSASALYRTNEPGSISGRMKHFSSIPLSIKSAFRGLRCSGTLRPIQSERNSYFCNQVRDMQHASTTPARGPKQISSKTSLRRTPVPY